MRRTRPSRRRPALLALALLACAAAAGPAAGAVTPAMDERLASAAADERIPAIATLRAQVDGERYEGRPAALLRALRRAASATQGDVTEEIDGPARRFWLVNAVAFAGTPDEIRAVADDPAVAEVDVDRPVRLADGGGPDPGAGGSAWGLAAVGAPAAWSAYGVRGSGVTVGVIDTGVNAAHPDLAGRIAGWRDLVGDGDEPYDDNGHGTHVAGTIAGGAAGGAPIGVAPGAELIVARALDAEGTGTASDLLAAAQWIADPDGVPATADAPAVVNNSWSAPDANETWFRPMVRRWVELGMLPVFAAGNWGPGPGTVGNPAGYPESLAVGALDAAGAVAHDSGRGPVVWQDADGLGPAAGTVLAKPDLAAPGVGVLSSVGAAGYGAYSGTSMAAPHVAGIAALVKEADPALDGAAIAQLLRATAIDVAAPGTDPDTGAGRPDALGALEAVLGPAPAPAAPPSPLTAPATPPAPPGPPAAPPAPSAGPAPATPPAPARGRDAARRPDGGAHARGRSAPVTLSVRQLRINQRISQAAIHRIAVLAARLDGRPAPPPPRPDPGARVELSAAQLGINQRISQAAVRRAAALAARIEGRPAPPAAAARTRARIALSAAQLRINQRISQAAIRRIAALGG